MVAMLLEPTGQQFLLLHDHDAVPLVPSATDDGNDRGNVTGGALSQPLLAARHQGGSPDNGAEKHMQTRMKNPAVVLPTAMAPIQELFKAARTGGVPETTLG